MISACIDVVSRPPIFVGFLFMAMNNEIEKKIRERYLQCDSKFFDKFVEQNQDVKQELESILSINPWFETIRNVYIAWNHNIYDVVKCKYCGEPLKVKDAIYGRHFYCSKKCADSDPCKIELQKKTCIEKYGASTPLLNDECRKKTIATCREKFGNDMFAGSNEYKRRVPSAFKKKEVQEKSKQTKIDKYGDNYGQKIFNKGKDKIISTNIEKYGVPYVLMNKDKQNETHDIMEQKYGNEYYWGTQQSKQDHYNIGFDRILSWNEYVIPLFSREQYEGREKEYRWKCVKCGNEFKQKIYGTGLGVDGQVPRCEKCFPNHTSSIAEQEVVEFIKSVYCGEILTKVQTILENRKELDVYLPEKHFAIEFDGLYWHSKQNGKDASYHLLKTEECLKHGIHLIHIFEDEWMHKKKIVKDRLLSILGSIEKRIFARKCAIRDICSGESNTFLEENHLQGADNSSIRYGLFYNNELVSVMTFGKPRFDNNHNYELIRFASKKEYNVIGGASRLLRYFRNNHNGSIVSYADRRYSDGTFYEKIGFVLKGISQPNYWYVKNNEKLSKYACQKYKLLALLGDGFDASLSERENMIKNGYDVIYDCGNLIFELK